MDELVILFLGLGVLLFVIAMVLLIIYVLAYWMIFKKAGEAGWKALIPVYSTYISYRLFWNTKMFVLCMVFAVLTAIFEYVGGAGVLIFRAASLGTIVLNIIMCIKLSKAFGHGTGFTVGLILLNPIFLLILAFNSSSYIGPDGRQDQIIG